MGFFSKLGASVGIGSAKVTLSAQPQQVPQGTRISISLNVAGGKAEQQITAVRVQLVHLWREEQQVSRTDDEGYMTTETEVVTRNEVVDDQVIGQAMTIKPEQSQQFQGELAMPYEAILNDRENWWEVWGIAEISGGKDSRQTVPIAVEPSLLATKFQEIVSTQLQWQLKDIRSGQIPGAVLLVYQAPADWQGTLDEIRCLLRSREGQLGVTLELDFKAQKFTDYFKALVGKDDRAAGLKFSSDDLNINPQNVVESLSQKMQQLTSQPQN